jgi:hypothetical protein
MSALGQWDPRQPLSWVLDTPGKPGVRWLDSLPSLRDAIAEVRSSEPSLSDFEVFQSILGTPRQRTSRLRIRHARQSRIDVAKPSGSVEAESRHFLAIAYSHFFYATRQLDMRPWRWHKWLCGNAQHIRFVVSFNYDLVLERLLSGWNVCFYRIPFRRDGDAVPVFKPHGLVDYDVTRQFVRFQVGYPLLFHLNLNDVPIVCLPTSSLLVPRREGLTVLPNESSRYRCYQWVKPGYEEFRSCGSSLTHCLFVGQSYMACDRPEIDELLESLDLRAEVIVANPNPPDLFLRRARNGIRKVTCWTQGPEDMSQ